MAPQFFLLISSCLVALIVLFSFWQDRRVTRAAPPAGTMVKTEEGLIHVIRRGAPSEEKLPVVMLHGTFANALDLDLDLGTDLAKDREVLLPDRPGHGYSERSEDAYRIDVQVAAMREAIKALGVDRYVLMGQSYGAATSLIWSLAYPEDVAGMVLIAPVTHPWPGGIRWYIRMANNPRYGWLFRRTFIALYARYGVRRGVAKALKGCRAASYYYDRARVALGFRASEFKWNAQDVCRLYEQMVPLCKRYKDIDIPVEIVAGTHDLTVLLPVHGQKLADELPDGGIDVIEEGGHALHHSHRENCQDALARVDARLDISRRSPLESALRAISAVFPQRTASKQEAS